MVITGIENRLINFRKALLMLFAQLLIMYGFIGCHHSVPGTVDASRSAVSASIIGEWIRQESAVSAYVLIVKSDGTFTMSNSNMAMDPNYWYGTYSLCNDILTMVIHEDFGGSERTLKYTVAASDRKLVLTGDSKETQEWIKASVWECGEPAADSIIGTWFSPSELGDYTMSLKTDRTFTMFNSNMAMDPNYWYGTYSLCNDILAMIIHEDFTGSTRIEMHTVSVTDGKLILADGRGEKSEWDAVVDNK